MRVLKIQSWKHRLLGLKPKQILTQWRRASNVSVSLVLPRYFWFSCPLHTNAVLFFLFTMLPCFMLLYSILLRQDWTSLCSPGKPQNATVSLPLLTGATGVRNTMLNFLHTTGIRTLIFRLAQLALYPYSQPLRPLVCIPYSAFWNLLLMTSDSL